MQKMLMVLMFSTLMIPKDSFAWGERGHHMICEVATRLVKDPNLKRFLSNRGNIMGHLCNIPDIHWKSLGRVAKEGDAAHFLDPEVAGLVAETIPSALSEYFAALQTADSAEQKADKLGTLWWRSEQFFDRAVAAGKMAASSPQPESNSSQNDSSPYNKNVYAFIVNIGLMGHFAGDASMPFHNSSDYDGWETGHGGIHSTYESSCVGFYDFALIQQVALESNIQSARFVPSNSAVETMRKISLASFSEKILVEELDKVLVPSSLTTNAQGKPVKVYAKRDKNEVICAPFLPLITKQMARSAVALASLWDLAYTKAGKPNFSGYRSFLYPLAPEFVGIDYVRTAHTPE